MRLTAVQVEYWRRHGPSDTFEQVTAIQSTWTRPPTPDFTRESFTPQRFVVRVRDPRPQVNDFRIMGVPPGGEEIDVLRALPLTVSGGVWQSQEFYIPGANYELPEADDHRFDGAVPVVGWMTDWSYNPRKRARASTPAVIPKEVENGGLWLKEIVDGLANANWTPQNAANPGEFGVVAHRLFSQRVAGQSGWYSDVWVEKSTRKIVAIGGSQPANTIASQLQQVDALYTKSGTLNVNDIIDPDDVYLVEVKTSVRGTLHKGQLDGYKAISHNTYALHSDKRWDAGANSIIKNPVCKVIAKLVSCIGILSTAIYVISYAIYDDMAWLINRLVKASQTTGTNRAQYLLDAVDSATGIAKNLGGADAVTYMIAETLYAEFVSTS